MPATLRWDRRARTDWWGAEQAGQSQWITDFQTQLAGDSGDVTAGEYIALDSFIASMVANDFLQGDPALHATNYRDKFLMQVWPVIGSFNTCFDTLIQVPSLATTLTQTAFVSGDFDNANGLTGDSTSKFVNSLVNMNTASSDASNGHISAYLKDLGNLLNTGVEAVWGPDSTGSYMGFLTGAPSFTINFSPNVTGTVGASGMYGGSIISSTSSDLYLHTPTGTSAPTNTTLRTFISNTGRWFRNRTFNTYFPGTIAFACLGCRGLSGSEWTTFRTAVNSLMSALGR